MASGHRGTAWSRAGRLLITGALAAVLVACGGSGDKDKGGSTSVLQADPTTVVTGSADRTTAARNARVDINGTVAADEQTINLDGNGTIDFAGKTFQLSLTVPAVGQIEERLVDDIIYIRIPDTASAQFGGKAWLKLDPRAFGAGQNPFGSLESSNPAQVLGTLEGAGQVTKVGDETVRGVHTVHYRAQIDVAKAAEAQGLTPQQRQQLQQALGGQTTIPEDVWIDDQGLVRRITVEFAAQPPGATGGTPSAAPSAAPSALQTRLTMEFYDYGQATAPVTPPPADQVTDFSQILGQIGQLGGAFGGGARS
jgi:hypothetical protein